MHRSETYTELSPLRLPSPSEDTLLACFTRWRHSRGATSSLRWTLIVEDFFLLKPIRFLWPKIQKDKFILILNTFSDFVAKYKLLFLWEKISYISLISTSRFLCTCKSYNDEWGIMQRNFIICNNIDLNISFTMHIQHIQR